MQHGTIRVSLKTLTIHFHFAQPEWKLADPLCTFVFCIMVAASSSKVVYDALVVMMEGKGISTCICHDVGAPLS